jgi:hypothetical protein
LFMPFQTIWDDGTKDMGFNILVLDAKTKKPLQQALLGSQYTIRIEYSYHQ